MKIVVTHVPAGFGHEKAAEAVCAALRESPAPPETILLNALDGMSPAYQRTFTQGYLDIIHRFPQIWGMAYHLSDLRGLAWAAYKLHRVSNASHGKILETILERHQPDAVIGTHFFPMEVAAYLKEKGRLRAKLITVITDLLPHNVWIAPGIDQYAVAAPVTRNELLRRGVAEERIRITGIPIASKFNRKGSRTNLQKKLGLRQDQWTLLVGSGGFGTGPIAELFKKLCGIREPIQILVVTGKNTALLRRLESLRNRASHAVTLYGFVDNMDELMDVSDLMVTKPGGLSCAEAMAKGLPLLLVSPIPGQESRNARILEQEGISRLAPRLNAVVSFLQQLRSHPERLTEMADRGQRFSRPYAAADVAQMALGES